MSHRIRLTALMTHPIQYYSPWFRFIEGHAQELRLTVLYAAEPSSGQQGVGFDEPFLWDVPMRAGYESEVLSPPRSRNRFDSDSFWGLDVPRVGASIERTRPDVVLLSGWHSAVQLRAIWACRRRGIPLLYRGDTHLENRSTGLTHLPWRTRTSWLLRRFARYLSVGKRVREYLRRFSIPGELIFNSPHAVNNDFFAQGASRFRGCESRASARREWHLPPDDFVVLFVGKLEPKKRLEDLVRAMALMKPEVSLLVVGRGSQEDACRRIASELGVRAVWLGFLNQAELPRAYAVADCLALPSGYGETWGLVVNEALATGLPCVVGDRVGCAVDLIEPGRTGWVFPTGHVEGLAENLERVRGIRTSGAFRPEWCTGKAADYSFEAATAGLVSACRSV